MSPAKDGHFSSPLIMSTAALLPDPQNRPEGGLSLLEAASWIKVVGPEMGISQKGPNRLKRTLLLIANSVRTLVSMAETSWLANKPGTQSRAALVRCMDFATIRSTPLPWHLHSVSHWAPEREHLEFASREDVTAEGIDSGGFGIYFWP